MTKHARLVLEDAKAAADELPSGESGPSDESTMRRRVVAVMALLRAVGNVLKDVDGRTSDALRRAVNEKWKEPKPLIFTEFIDGYRAAVLKRYQQPGIDFEIEMGTLFPRLYVQLAVDEGAVVFSLNYLVQVAIEYWEQYLDDVDRLTGIYESEAKR